MKDTANDKRFFEAADTLCERVAAVLRTVRPDQAAQAQEIRMRVDRPLALYTGSAHVFLDTRGGAHDAPPADALIVTRTDLYESFRTLCGYSVHTHQYEIARGYISLPGGHRAGVCGTVAGEGEHAGLREVSSINLRVAREMRGIATPLMRGLFARGPCGILLAGAPSSGKTTLLRDIARTLGSGELGHYYKVALVDERCELAAVHQGTPQNDIGICTDLLYGYGKSVGIEIAIRTLSPQVLVCDEVGRTDELEAIRMGLYSAVHFITTVHCASREDLKRRRQARELLRTGAFDKVVLLSGSDSPGTVRETVDMKQL